MPETLTESFCERCGTRPECKAPTRLNPLRKTRGFIGGLKNYLISQDAIGDAMRDAMRQEEEALAAGQLEAFHGSFNFCIDCRQYTCVNCWNDAAGRCRTCAPIPGTDDLAERVAASLATHAASATATPPPSEDDLERRPGLESWPSADLESAAASRGAPPAWPEADAAVANELKLEPAWAPEEEDKPVAPEAPQPARPDPSSRGPSQWLRTSRPKSRSQSCPASR